MVFCTEYRSSALRVIKIYFFSSIRECCHTSYLQERKEIVARIVRRLKVVYGSSALRVESRNPDLDQKTHEEAVKIIRRNNTPVAGYICARGYAVEKWNPLLPARLQRPRGGLDQHSAVSSLGIHRFGSAASSLSHATGGLSGPTATLPLPLHRPLTHLRVFDTVFSTCSFIPAGAIPRRGAAQWPLRDTSRHGR